MHFSTNIIFNLSIISKCKQKFQSNIIDLSGQIFISKYAVKQNKILYWLPLDREIYIFTAKNR
jgi:hypothetical protein